MVTRKRAHPLVPKMNAPSLDFTDWSEQLPIELASQKMVSLCFTTQPQISDHLVRHRDGRFFLVHWDCVSRKYRWQSVNLDYAFRLSEPVAKYREARNWLEMYDNPTEGGLPFQSPLTRSEALACRLYGLAESHAGRELGRKEAWKLLNDDPALSNHPDCDHLPDWDEETFRKYVERGLKKQGIRRNTPRAGRNAGVVKKRSEAE